MAATTVVVDFDGVLHSYVSGWLGETNIPDPPSRGAMAWLKDMVDDPDFEVVIQSTRARYNVAVTSMIKWLIHHGLTETQVARIKITSEKAPAVLYIDDRAYLFQGKWPSKTYIKQFRPYRLGGSSK